MDWDKIGRIGAAIATGGTSELAIAVADEAERRKQQEQQRAQGVGAGPVGTATPPAVPQQPPCCRYHLEPPFLLDTESGRVWRYDENKQQFIVVPREVSPIEKSWESLLTAKLVADAVDALNESAKLSSRAEHSRLAELVDAHIKAMDEHLKQIKR